VVSSGEDLQDSEARLLQWSKSLAASHLDFTVVLFGEKRHMVDELRKRQLMMTQDGFGYRAEFFS